MRRFDFTVNWPEMDTYTRKLFRGSGWGLVSSVIWPVILMFSVKICKILMFSVLKKFTVKCLKVIEQ